MVSCSFSNLQKEKTVDKEILITPPMLFSTHYTAHAVFQSLHRPCCSLIITSPMMFSCHYTTGP
jgi:hypothetical protein